MITRNASLSARITVVFVILFSTFGCKKFVQIPASPSTLTSAQIFADSADATAALTGVYSSFNVGSPNFSIGNGAITLYTGLSGDELQPIGGAATLTQFYNNNVSATTNGVIGSTFWAVVYNFIYQLNACIEGASGSSGLDLVLRNQLVGEAKFMRAFMYFNLVNLYGAVPLVVSTNYTVNASLGRTSVDSIYNQIKSDLLDAQNRLTPAYVTGGKVRPNLYTATALLAKVYLYNQKWDSAIFESTKVISSGLYFLEPDLNNVFLANSNEAIFQILPVVAEYETTEGLEFVPSKSTLVPKYVIGQYLLSAFEGGDQRRYSWIDSNIVAQKNYYYPYKYKFGFDGLSTPVENYMICRLGEQYLIRAEAEANSSGDLDTAIGDLNVIRGRAGLGAYAGSADQASVLNAIYHERQVELFCEWGNRWYDLKRWGIINNVLGVEKASSWPSDGHAALYPISYNQIEANPFLVQNPGY